MQAFNLGKTHIESSSSTDVIRLEVERIRTAYAKRHVCSWYSMFEPAQMLAVQERERELLRAIASVGIASSIERARILEIGCGSGAWLRDFVRWGAQPENIVGVDLLPERIAEARRLCPAGVKLTCQSAADLGSELGPFDLVLQSTVFTSILEPLMKQQIASEMLRVLTDRGVIVWYDFYVNNPGNPDVRGIGRIELEQLFPGCSINVKRLTLAPPLGRPLARMSRKLYVAASAIKVLCTHFLGIITKK